MHYLFYFFPITSLNIKLVTNSYLFSFNYLLNPFFLLAPIFIALLEHWDAKEHKII